MEKSDLMKESTIEKHKRVIDEWLHNGRNGTKAYMLIYPESSSDNARIRFSKLVTNSNIQNYIERKEIIMQDKAEESHGITMNSQIEECKRLVELHKELVELASKEALDPVQEDRFKRLKEVIKSTDVNKAIDTLNKMLGFYEDHNKQKGGETKKQTFIIGGKEVEF